MTVDLVDLWLAGSHDLRRYGEPCDECDGPGCARVGRRLLCLTHGLAARLQERDIDWGCSSCERKVKWFELDGAGRCQRCQP